LELPDEFAEEKYFLRLEGGLKEVFNKTGSLKIKNEIFSEKAQKKLRYLKMLFKTDVIDN